MQCGAHEAVQKCPTTVKVSGKRRRFRSAFVTVVNEIEAQLA
jgi:hypothetical protein